MLGCRREALSIWKSGLGSQATYRALIEVFVRAGRVNCAETIVAILSEGAEMTARLLPCTAASTVVPTANTEAAGGGVQGTATTPGLQTPSTNTGKSTFYLAENRT